MNNKTVSIIKSWLPLAVAITLLSLMIYIVAQQVYRHSADDPQIQMAEDAAVALASGIPASSIVGDNSIDMASSLSPYLIVFDETGAPVASSITLDGKTPLPPAGVLDYTKAHKQDRITWQPRPGLRHAAIMVYFNGKQSGYVLAGRSMREVENRIGKLGQGVLLGWVVTLFCTLAIVIMLEFVQGAINRQDNIR